MVRDGVYYAAASAAGGLAIQYLTGPAFAVPLFVAAGFFLWFFRDPDREAPAGDVAVSPADGKVLSVAGLTPELTRVSIFMNVFDVHVNRSPIAGRISEVKYRRGRFLVASRERAAVENEQNTVTVEGPGASVTFTQIAGLIARRIVFYKKPGDAVRAGERVGLIKFGSRVDVFFGPEWRIEVADGQRVKAGSSVLARRK